MCRMEFQECFMVFHMFCSYSNKSQKFINMKGIVCELCMCSTFRMMTLKKFWKNDIRNIFIAFRKIPIIYINLAEYCTYEDYSKLVHIVMLAQGTKGIALLILNISMWWRPPATFMPRLHYPRKKTPAPVE